MRSAVLRDSGCRYDYRMDRPRHESAVSSFENDYQVISLSISWGMVSITAFVAIVALQIFDLGANLTQVVFATMGLAIGGFALGLIGLKFGRSRVAARTGAFLNGVVLLCIIVILPVTLMVLRWLR